MDSRDDPATEEPASGRPSMPPSSVRSPRDIEQQRIILLRKARAFMARGHDHPAEVAVNRALELGAPVSQVSSALDDLGPTAACLSRRQALQRTTALIAGGAIIGPATLRGHATTGSAQAAKSDELTAFVTRSGPTGLFMTIPSDLGDGSYAVAAVTASGLARASGPYTGDIVTRDNRAYSAGQSWSDGRARTTVTVIRPDGRRRSFTLPAAGSANGAAVAESTTSIALVGTTLYCLHTWLRVVKGTGGLPAAKSGRPLIRLTSQPIIEVIDLAAGRLKDRWIGPEVAGACRAALKVSADGSGVLVAADMPSAAADVPRVYAFRLDHGRLSLANESVATLDALASQYYFWPAGIASIVQVAHDSVHQYAPTLGTQASAGLPALIGNNRKTPGFQASFSASGASLISSGDGRVFGVPASSATAHLVTTLPGKTLDPPCLVYQGARLGSVFAPADAVTWLIDNREGVGGIWRLDSSGRETAHELAGTYLSACRADSSGRFIAAVSSLERVLYLLDPAGRAAAFTVPTHAQLVRASGRN